jgi:hypothetical protein
MEPEDTTASTPKPPVDLNAVVEHLIQEIEDLKREQFQQQHTAAPAAKCQGCGDTWNLKAGRFCYYCKQNICERKVLGFFGSAADKILSATICLPPRYAVWDDVKDEPVFLRRQPLTTMRRRWKGRRRFVICAAFHRSKWGPLNVQLQKACACGRKWQVSKPDRIEVLEMKIRELEQRGTERASSGISRAFGKAF